MHKIGMKALAAALLAGVAAPAFAADPVDPVVEVIEQPAFGGWYLRGHIGMSNQRIDGLESSLYDVPAAHGWLDEGEFGSAPTFGVGLGYQFNDFLRGDLTVEYRGSAEFSALDWLQETAGGPVTTNDYSARKSEWLLLANAYADLGTFYGITPYVGAGIGASRNTISSFRDVNVITDGAAYAAETSRWDFAWALHAGLGIKATERMTIDLGYSYVSLGDGETGELKNDRPGFFPPPGNDGITFKDIASHDFKLGVRYSLN